ncbi:MAG: xanthine dehydrogenase family protein [bacterium]|nr:xanthine dehydrogenase family protein [bacterium]
MGIGSDIPRVEGPEKLRGDTRYIDDIRLDGVLHGGTVRAPAARGRITRIHFDPSVNWDEYVIVDHRDIPGPNEVAHIDKDQPALVASEFRHRHEPVVLIAHRSTRALRRGLQSVRIEYEPLPAITDPWQKLVPELIQYGDDNVFKRIDIRKGALEAAFARAAHVIEGRYRTGAQEHVYLETNGMLAYQQDGRLVVQGSMQCPYFVLKAMTHFFGRPQEQLRVIQSATGGAFGGKEDYPSILAIHAGLLAEKSGAPVKIVYDRGEDMAATTKRHPGWVRHRTAVDADGRLLAMEVEAILDGGAYSTMSPVVLSRGVIHATGPYSCENIHVHGEARLTNSSPYGAFRGFGVPQTEFAIERHMDVIAEQIALDPVELRRRNLLRDGQTMATGQICRDGVDLVALMDGGLARASYAERRAEYARTNGDHPYLRRGIGFSVFLHGAGFTGGGETMLASELWVEGRADGLVEVLAANTEMGQGAKTVLMQIAADSLGLSEDQIVVAEPDTARVPNSGPTVASRTTMIVGKLLERACRDLASTVGVDGPSLPGAIRAWHKANPSQRLIGRAKYEAPKHIRWDEATYRGDAYSCFAWAVHVADIEVDLRTYMVRVCDYVALQEVGKVVNPTMAAGQIRGGVAQGIGWALTEDVVLEDGAMANTQLSNYTIPSSADLPPIRVFFEEQPLPYGPGGAKGIGELPMDGPAPAIVNAVCQALGTNVSRIPLTPERLMAHLEGETDG